MNSFQFVSDLHLDVWATATDSKEPWLTIIRPVGQYLLIAGDTAELRWPLWSSFLNYCSHNWQQICIITGNHEYYHNNCNVAESDHYMKQMCAAFANVHFLQMGQLDIDQVVILGCTLWTHIPAHATKDVQHSIKDFKSIKDMSIDVYQELNQTHFHWLQDRISSLTQPCIIMTHHAPLRHHTSAPRYERSGQLSNYCYSNDMYWFMKHIPAGSYWVYGHTHWRTSFEVSKIRIVSFPHGYPSEILENPDMNNSFSI